MKSAQYVETIIGAVPRVHSAEVKVLPMLLSEANQIVTQHHYLHRPRPAGFALQIFWKEQAVGVLIYAKPMVAGKCCGYLPTEIVELARMWFSENPANLGSCAFRKSIPLLLQKWPTTRAIVSWCDRTKFDGAFYRAAGFKFNGIARLRSAEPSSLKYGGGRPNRVVHSDRLHRKDRFLLVL